MHIKHIKYIKKNKAQGKLKTGFRNENLCGGMPLAENFLKTVKPFEKHFQTLKQKFKDEEILQVAAFVSMLVAESTGEELFSNLLPNPQTKKIRT